MQFETVKTSLIQLNSALCMKLLTQTHKPQVFISIYHTYLAKIHGLTTSASSMKCVVKTTTRPSRAARMMIHTCPLSKFFRYLSISESSCRSSTALVCEELEFHRPYQLWMLHLHFLRLELKHHHEVQLKSYILPIE